MAARYQHVTDPIRREVASRVGGGCGHPAGTDETGTETRGPPLEGRDRAARCRPERLPLWWRRWRDLNPREGCALNPLSRRAP